MHGFGPDYLYVTVALNRTKMEECLVCSAILDTQSLSVCLDPNSLRSPFKVRAFGSNHRLLII